MCSVPIPTDHIPHSKESPPEKKTQTNNKTIRELSQPFTCVRVNSFKKSNAIWSSCVPIIDYNRSLIENLMRRNNRLWGMINRVFQKNKKQIFETGVLSFQRNPDDTLIRWFNPFLIYFVSFCHVLKHGIKVSVPKKKNQKFKLLWFAHRWKINGLLRAFSDCYQWSIYWVNPIISDWDDRLRNLSRLSALIWSQPDLRKDTLSVVRR